MSQPQELLRRAFEKIGELEVLLDDQKRQSLWWRHEYDMLVNLHWIQSEQLKGVRAEVWFLNERLERFSSSRGEASEAPMLTKKED